jgi:hypothetical protein
MLTQISTGYQNDDFVASRFFPSIGVNKQSDKYYVHNREVWGRATDDVRTPGSRSNELPPMTLSRDSYFTEEHSLKGLVTAEDVKNADNPLQPAMDETERVTNTILLNREKAMVTMLTTAANFGSGFTVTLATTALWTAYSTSTPVADVKAGKKKVHDVLFRDPNTMAVQYEVAIVLEDHTAIIDRIKYTTGKATTDEVLSDLFGLSFFRAGAGNVTSVYGQAETVDYMWPTDVVMAYVPPVPARKTPAFAYEFVESYGSSGVMPTERWYEQDRKTDIVQVSRKYDLKYITIDGSSKAVAGYLIKNAINP